MQFTLQLKCNYSDFIAKFLYQECSYFLLGKNEGISTVFQGFIFFCVFFLQPVSSKGTLSIQLIDYYNPTSKDYGGSCCDCCGVFGYCLSDCENFFWLIVTSYPYTFFSALSPWAKWETDVLGDDSFDFPGYGHSVASGLKNPLTYHFTVRWPVRLICYLI